MDEDLHIAGDFLDALGVTARERAHERYLLTGRGSRHRPPQTSPSEHDQGQGEPLGRIILRGGEIVFERTGVEKEE